MPADALALTLLAAVLHAAWNAGLAGQADARAATAAAILSGAVLIAPVTVLSYDIDAAAWPYLGGAIAAEAVYMALLGLAYSRAELSVVYPVARGSAPLFVLVVTGASLVSAVGVVVVVAGVIAVRGLKAPERSSDLFLALGIGVAIATYTTLDKHGLAHASTVPYLGVELGSAALLNAVLLGPARLRPQLGTRTTLVGIGVFVAYGLVLAALELAPAAAVSAVRETSVVFAVALGALFLGERVTAARAAGAVVVAAGVALIAAA